MKKASRILAVTGLVLFILVFFNGVDVFDEQAFRWRVEYWALTESLACFAAATILCAIRAKKTAPRILWAVLSLFPLCFAVDMIYERPRLIYSDSHYQMWDNNNYWKLYYGTGLVMNDAGGTPGPYWGKLDSCRAVMYDSLGVIWVEAWSSYQGKPYEHEGELVPIDSRFSRGNYELHTDELDSLLAAHIHDSVEPGKWYKTRSIRDLE